MSEAKESQLKKTVVRVLWIMGGLSVGMLWTYWIRGEEVTIAHAAWMKTLAIMTMVVVSFDAAWHFLVGLVLGCLGGIATDILIPVKGREPLWQAPDGSQFQPIRAPNGDSP